MTEENPKKQTPEMIALAAEPKIIIAEGEPLVEPEDKLASTQNKEAEEDRKNNAKYKVEDAICHIMSENTCDYKDFHFPTNKMDVLLYRMHHEINGRIQVFKDENMEVEDIITAYRNRHSKADDIEFIIKTYKAMDINVRPVANPANVATASNAGPPVVADSSAASARGFLPTLFEPIGSQAAGLEPRERAQMRRRSVRFQHAPARECRREDETKDEK